MKKLINKGFKFVDEKYWAKVLVENQIGKEENA